MLVEFDGEIEAETQEEAERLAIYDDTCQYQGVYSMETKEIEEEEEEEGTLLPDGLYGGMEDSMDW
jgi:nickel-dependent lactate racemase